jgi:signal transduction histidine kinase
VTLPQSSPTADTLLAPLVADFRLRELMAVREIVRAFLTAERPEQVFQIALDRVSPLVGATLSCVYLVEPGSDSMHLAAVHNWPPRWERFLGLMRVKVGSGPSGAAAGERRVIEVADVYADTQLGDWREVADELGFRALVALPLETTQGVLGTVTFYFRDAGSFGADARNLLRMVADQMAATAEKARLIEDLRRANAHLAETNAELEHQNVALLEARRVKDEFLANISHELRTPLTAVMGYIALMQEGLMGPVNDEQQASLSQVASASEQLLQLIGDLLELTTLKRGGAELEHSTFDAREALRDAVAQAQGRRPDVALVVSEPEHGAILTTDRRKLVKLLVTLLSNAYKFTHEGEIEASVEVDEAIGRVAYLVRDTGIGIPREAHELVFEEFRQVDGSSTRRYGGSGLGLALARQLARLLGGEVSVSSEAGAGATFRVELPLLPTAGRHVQDPRD